MVLVWDVCGEGSGPVSLRRVIGQHRDHIEGTTKGPVVQRSSETDLSHVLEKDEQKVIGIIVFRVILIV